MIDKISINQIPDPRQDGVSSGQQNHPKPAVNDQTDATLRIDFGRLIEQAVNTPPPDKDAVQKAREILESGRLDNPGSIREAAENIIKFGV